MIDTSANVRSQVISVINGIATEHGKWQDTRREKRQLQHEQLPHDCKYKGRKRQGMCITENEERRRKNTMP